MGSFENIVGAPFEDWVIDQFKLRSKFNGVELRDSSNISSVANNGCWIRITSNVLQNKDNSNSKLANKWILQGGTLSQDGLKYGIKDNALYSHGNLGFRPMPGIESAKVESAGVAGSLRVATIRIKAWDLDQLDKIDTLYLRLGWSVFIEWGHSVYYDNNGIKQNGFPLENYDKIKTEDELLKQIYLKKQASNGNYDAMFGIISNYEWVQNETLGYDILLKVVGKGQVIDSLTITKPFDGKGSIINEKQINPSNSVITTLQQKPDTLAIKNTSPCTLTMEGVVYTPQTFIDLNLSWFNPNSTEKNASGPVKLGSKSFNIVVASGDDPTHDNIIKYDSNINGIDLLRANEKFVQAINNAFLIKKREEKLGILSGFVEKPDEQKIQEINNILSFFGVNKISALKEFVTPYELSSLSYFFQDILSPSPISIPGDILFKFLQAFTGVKNALQQYNLSIPACCNENVPIISGYDSENQKLGKVNVDLIDIKNNKFLYTLQASATGILTIPAITIIVDTNDILFTNKASANASNIIYNNKNLLPNPTIRTFLGEWFRGTINSLPEDVKYNSLSFEVKNTNTIEATIIPIASTGETGTTSTQILDTVNSIRQQLQTSDRYKDVLQVQSIDLYKVKLTYTNSSVTPAQNETNDGTQEEQKKEEDKKAFKSELENFLIQVKEFAKDSPEGLVDGYRQFLSKIFETSEGPLSSLFKENNQGPELYSYNSRYMHDPNIDKLKPSNIDLLSRIFRYSWEMDKENQSFCYISLGALIAYLNHKCLLYYNNSNDKKKTHPYIRIDFNTETNLCLTSPQQLSIDPKICLVENSITTRTLSQLVKPMVSGSFTPEMNDKLDTLNLNSSNISNTMLGSGFRYPGNPYVGRIMLIYLNIDKLLEIISNLQSTNVDRNVYLRPFLEQILDEVNIALGGINKFRVSYYDEGNTVRIVDDQTIHRPETISLQKLKNNQSSKSFTPFPIEIVGKNSVVKKLQFKTEISNKLHTMIAISAQAGNYGQIKDASSFGDLQTGLTDRFLENKILTSTDGENLNKQISYFLDQITNVYCGNVSLNNEKSYSTPGVIAAKEMYLSLLNKNKSENKTIKGKDIIPLSLNITTDGISGISVLQSFTVPPRRMPSQYYYPDGTPKVGWVISRQEHNISLSGWDTTLTGLMILIPEKSTPDPIDPIDDINLSYPPGSLPESTWSQSYLWSGGFRISKQPVGLVSIDGSKVAKPFEQPLRKMLKAAQDEKVNIKVGSGYRTFQEQLNIRKSRSGGNNYPITTLLTLPPSAFSPVTGLPGHSKHQSGTAFDLHGGNSLITSRDSTEYKWLEKNASKYGFKNTVSSEPWHWEYIQQNESQSGLV